MKLRRFGDAAAFSRHVAGYLLVHESEHNLLLGLSARLAMHPLWYGTPPYLAAVESDGAVVAVALMTPPHPLQLSRTDNPVAWSLVARDLAAAVIAPSGVAGASAASAAFVAAWRAETGQDATPGLKMRIYALTRVIPVTGVPGVLRPATVADRNLIIAWLDAFSDETGQDGESHGVDARLADPASALHLWEVDGQAVAMAGQTGPTPHGVRINAVYTPPALRGNGYASACVAALSQQLLDGGRRFRFLYTDLANPTANTIYRRVGYEPVADADGYRFVAR